MARERILEVGVSSMRRLVLKRETALARRIIPPMNKIIFVSEISYIIGKIQVIPVPTIKSILSVLCFVIFSMRLISIFSFFHFFSI